MTRCFNVCKCGQPWDSDWPITKLTAVSVNENWCLHMGKTYGFSSFSWGTNGNIKACPVCEPDRARLAKQ